MIRASMIVLTVAVALPLSGQYGGQSGYYAILGHNDRGLSPYFPEQPWPDFLCRHDHGPVHSVCERGL